MSEQQRVQLGEHVALEGSALNNCAPDGGFWLASGAVVDDATPETLRAMLEAGRRWCG